MELSNIELNMPLDNNAPNFRTKKWEFVYFKDNNPVPEDTPYRILVLKDKSEVYIKMKTISPNPYVSSNIQFEEYGEVMLKRDPINNSTSRFRYLRFANGDNSRDAYIKPHQVVITKKMREKGEVERYFARYKLEKDSSIFEIKKQHFDMDNTSFYEKVRLTWIISGIKDNVRKLNEEFLMLANDTLDGIIYHLDPLEFYEEEVKLTPKEITMKKLERLLHNPHSYSSHSEASNIGNALGLSGTHQMPDGTWMPGSTHAEYLNAMNNRTIQTPAGNIPTQNLRRNSEY